MKTRWLLAVASTAICAQAAATLAACATDAGGGEPPTEDRTTPVPTPETDGGLDSGETADAGACTDDCEFYPDECTDDALCMAPLFGSDPPVGLDFRTGIFALAARSPNDAWLTGAAGTAAHFDGTSWKLSDTGIQNSLYGLWLLGAAEIAFDSPRRLYARGLPTVADAGEEPSAGGWAPFPAVTIPSAWSQMRVMTTWAQPGSNTLFIAARGNTPTGSTSGGLWRLRYSPATNAFTLDATTLNRCNDLPCREIYGLDGRSDDEVWAVGLAGAALRITDANATSPTLKAFNTQTLYALHGVWAPASDDVWAVGSTGTVRRYRGDERFWEVYDELPTKQHLYAIAGSSPSDIWIAGDEGTVFHYDGASWTRVKVAGLDGRRPRLDRIWVRSPGKVWIAGQGALVSLGGNP